MDCSLKICSKCKQELPLTSFHKASDRKSKYKSHCKSCISKKQKETYREPEQYRRRMENHWRYQGIEMTMPEYEKLLEAQNGCCAVCGATENKNGTRLCVDHCHTTGQIRGLLCHDCNTGIGKLGDSKEGLMKAIKYLDNSLGRT